MTASQVNALFRRNGLLSRIRRGEGYYYWLDDLGNLVDAPSMHVFRADDIPVGQWLSEAREVDAMIRRERGMPNPVRRGSGGDDGDRVLHRSRATDEDLHDLWDVVVLDEEPDGDEAEEAAGLVLDDGEVVAPGVGELGRFFRSIRRSGDVVVATGPLDPEDARINAEKRRRDE